MQKDIASDQELNLKKRARRRLVGAIALVVMMVILLPMLLKDRAVSAPTEAVTISLPNENNNGQKPSDFDSSIKPDEANTVEENTSDTNTDLADNSNAKPKKIIPLETLKDTRKTDADVIDSEASKAKKASQETTAQGINEDNSLDSQNVANPIKGQEKIALDDQSLKTAKPSADKDRSSNLFYVQVGVFSDAANVKKLQTKLTDLGYTSKTEKMNTDKGPKIKLRTQTFNDRNEAAIALENIKDAGLTGMVVSH